MIGIGVIELIIIGIVGLLIVGGVIAAVAIAVGASGRRRNDA